MRYLSAIVALAALLPTAALADQVNLAFGGDTYAAGQTAAISLPVGRDVFAGGYDVSLVAPVTGNAHLAGYSVNSNASVGGDLYAAGFAVTVTGAVGRDVTAMGNTVVLSGTTPIAGNARLAGASLVLDTPVQGSLLASASSFTLNAPVTGDVSFYGENITFGPNARVSGHLSIQAPKEIAVPATVAAADHVSFQQLSSPDYAGEAGKTARSIFSGFWFAVWATLMWWLLLFVVGVAFIALAPRLVSDLTTLAAIRPFRRLGLGALTFASTLGLLIVAILTLVGIVLLPFVLLYVVVACSLAYLAGVYLIGARIWQAVRPMDSNLERIGVLAASLILGGLLTMIPFLGWAITLLLLAFGFGVVAARAMARWGRGDAAQLSISASSGPPPAAIPTAI